MNELFQPTKTHAKTEHFPTKLVRQIYYWWLMDKFQHAVTNML